MEKYIPIAKRSKKEQRKLNSAKRVTWGALNPVTRKPNNSGAYNRKKAQRWRREVSDAGLFSCGGEASGGRDGISHIFPSQIVRKS